MSRTAFASSYRSRIKEPCQLQDGTLENPIDLLESDDEDFLAESGTTESVKADPAANTALKKTEENEVEFECAVCLECPNNQGDIATIDVCAHRFCFGCIKTSSERNNKCPLCRKAFVVVTSHDGIRNLFHLGWVVRTLEAVHWE